MIGNFTQKYDATIDFQRKYTRQRHLSRLYIYMHLIFKTDSSIKLQPYNPENPNQCWVINENRIQNKINPNLVIDIRQGNRDRGAGLCAYQYHGGPNQLFTFNIVVCRSQFSICIRRFTWLFHSFPSARSFLQCPLGSAYVDLASRQN